MKSSKEESETLKCSSCLKQYSNKKILKTHINTVHRVDKFTCTRENCNKKYTSHGGLRLHNMNVHGKNEERKCDFCDKTYPSQPGLEQHIKKSHSNVNNVKHVTKYSNQVKV